MNLGVNQMPLTYDKDHHEYIIKMIAESERRGWNGDLEYWLMKKAMYDAIAPQKNPVCETVLNEAYGPPNIPEL